MAKTLPTVLLALSLLALTCAAPVDAYGACVGICIDVADTNGDGEYRVQTCTGNVNVQVGLSNEAHFCGN